MVSSSCVASGPRLFTRPESLNLSLVSSLFYVHDLVWGAFPRLFPPGWSLEAEVQFYVLAPVLFWLWFGLKETRARILFASGVLLATTLLSTCVPQRIGPVFVYFSILRFFPMFFLGVVLAGPIANQVLVARWFRGRRGQAMGYAYLGLGLGGVVSPLLINFLSRSLGWRHALELVGALVMLVLFPVGIWVTRSGPEELGLTSEDSTEPERAQKDLSAQNSASVGIAQAVRSGAFWLIITGSTLVIGTVGAVIQHLILFLKDTGYSATAASRFSTILLTSSLAGRVVVGYLADRFRKTHLMAFFYFLIGASVFLLAQQHSSAGLWTFAIIFGFSMGADYMLIPLVTAECFGTASLGKLLALIIMLYSVGQWGFPWIVGRIFDARHSYDLAWKMAAAAGVIGAMAIYAIPAPTLRRRAAAPPSD